MCDGSQKPKRAYNLHQSPFERLSRAGTGQDNALPFPQLVHKLQEITIAEAKRRCEQRQPACRPCRCRIGIVLVPFFQEEHPGRHTMLFQLRDTVHCVQDSLMHRHGLARRFSHQPAFSWKFHRLEIRRVLPSPNECNEYTCSITLRYNMGKSDDIANRVQASLHQDRIAAHNSDGDRR